MTTSGRGLRRAPSLAGERVLVTGASGFLGARLQARLLDAGAEVHAVSRFPQTSADVRWWSLDICDTEAVRTLVRKVRPVSMFHLASHVTGSRELHAVIPTLRSNLVGTVNLLVAAAEAGGPRVVLAGSLEEPDGTDSEPLPVSPYAAAKFASSAYARMFHCLYGLPVVVLRVFMVYGPGQRDETKLVPHVITSLLREEPPELSSGRRLVDWVYVDDVVHALLVSATADTVVGKTIDVGSGILTPIRDVVETLMELMEPAVEPVFGALPDRPRERIRAADVARTEALLGWRATTPLKAGLAATVEWFVAQRAVA